MPLRTEIESADGQFSKEINVKTCPQKVTGNYRVVNSTKLQNKWPHLTQQCSFAKAANNGLVHLLVGIDNAELHYSHASLISEGKVADPSPALDNLRLTKTKLRERDLTSFLPCLQKSLLSLYGGTEGNPAEMSITALRGSRKSRSLAQNVITLAPSHRGRTTSLKLGERFSQV